MKRLICDIDGVLADIASGIISWLGYPENSWEYDMRLAYPQVDPSYIDILLTDPRFYEDLYPIPGSRKHLNELARWWEVVYYTNRPAKREISGVTAQWLARGDYPVGDLWVLGDKPKLEFIAERVLPAADPVVAIEDNAEVARELAARVETLLLLSHYWPYNHGGCGLARPMGSWADISEFLEGRYGDQEGTT